MASHSYGMNVSFAVALCFFIVGATENTPELIADGLLVSGGTLTTAVRSLQSKWTLHVIIGKSAVENTLDTQISRVHNLISNYPSTRRSDRSTSSYWQQRLHFLRPIAPLTVSSRERNRRGFFDLGGQMLHQVFGVATSEQIETSRKMIQLVRASNKQILHQSNKMVTVINQTYHEIILHQEHIVKVEKAISELYVHVQSWIALHNVALEKIRAGLRIDRCLSLLESAHFAWTKQRTRFIAQRLALESGRLSETLLPTEELLEILRHSHTRGFYTPNLGWFYEFVTVTPLWKNENELIYVANLPLSGHTMYLRYHIKTFPFLHTPSKTFLQMQMPGNVAYDTTDGLVFKPYRCMGRNPEICYTGPIYAKTHFSCLHGVLTNNAALRDTCTLTIHRNKMLQESVREISTNEFIIVSNGAILDLFCEGKPSKTVRLPIGTSKVHLSPHCRLSTKQWMINGIMSYDMNLTLTSPAVRVIAFNWTNFISSKTIHAHLALKKWQDLPQIPNVSLKQLPDDIDDSTDWLLNDISPAYKWPLLFLLILVITTALLVIGYKYNWIRFLQNTPSPTPKIITHDIEMNPLRDDKTLPVSQLPAAQCESLLSTHAEIIASD